MELDKHRIYTVVNADEVKLGSAGYFADNIYSLQQAVQYKDKECFGKVEGIKDIDTGFRFVTDNDACFSLFYLAEEPEEKKLRPFKNTDDMMTEFCRRSVKLPPATIDPPIIYFKNKISGRSYIMSAFDCHLVKIRHETYDMVDLFNNFTFNDGSPCGIEE